MDNLGAVTLALLALGTLRVSLAAPLPDPQASHHHKECHACSPGTGVISPCNATHDTLCTPCPEGYFSSKSSQEERCSPCSLCGLDLFEFHPCNSTNDVFCEHCIKIYLPENEDYMKKCSSSKIIQNGYPDHIDRHIIKSNPLKGSHKSSSEISRGPRTSRLYEIKSPFDIHDRMVGDDPEVYISEPVPEDLMSESEVDQVKNPLVPNITTKQKDDIITDKYIYVTNPLPEIDNKETEIFQQVPTVSHGEGSESRTTNEMSVNPEGILTQPANSPSPGGGTPQDYSNEPGDSPFQHVTPIAFEDRTTSEVSLDISSKSVTPVINLPITAIHDVDTQPVENIEVVGTTPKITDASDFTDVYKDDELLPIEGPGTHRYGPEKTTTVLNIGILNSTGISVGSTTDSSGLREQGSGDSEESSGDFEESSGDFEESSGDIGSGDIDFGVLSTTPKVAATTTRPYRYTRRKWLPFRKRTTTTSTTTTITTSTTLTTTQPTTITTTFRYRRIHWLPFRRRRKTTTTRPTTITDNTTENSSAALLYTTGSNISMDDSPTLSIPLSDTTELETNTTEESPLNLPFIPPYPLNTTTTQIKVTTISTPYPIVTNTTSTTTTRKTTPSTTPTVYSSKTWMPSTTTHISRNESAVGVFNVQDPILGETKEKHTPSFAIAIAAVTSGVIFFAVGFFYTRHSRKHGNFSPDERSNGTKPIPNHYEMVPASDKPVAPPTGGYIPNPLPKDEVEPTERTKLFGHPEEEDEEGSEGTPVGTNQSPIDIDADTAELDDSLEKNLLKFNYASPGGTSILRNTGNAIIIEEQGTGSVLTGGPLGQKKFCLNHIVFHWGATASRGSEHSINGQRYSGEIQFIHWNCEDYISYVDASKSEDGLAALAVFLKAQVVDDSGYKLVQNNYRLFFDEVEEGEDEALTSVTNCLQSIQFKGEARELPDTFNHFDLLPVDRDDYWTYQGSLTRAPYSETVTWVVFKDHLTVSFEQMEEFRRMKKYERSESLKFNSRDGRFILDNFRNTQPIKDRTIRSSFV